MNWNSITNWTRTGVSECRTIAAQFLKALSKKVLLKGNANIDKAFPKCTGGHGKRNVAKPVL